MDLTKEQIEEIVAAVVAKVNLSSYASKEEVITAVKSVAEKIPASIDTSKFVTEEKVKGWINEALTTLENKINADLQKVIKKVFPEQTAPQRKSQWFAFD